MCVNMYVFIVRYKEHITLHINSIYLYLSSDYYKAISYPILEKTSVFCNCIPHIFLDVKMTFLLLNREIEDGRVFLF